MVTQFSDYKSKPKSKSKGKSNDNGSTKYNPSKNGSVSRATIKRTWTARPPQEWLSLLKEIAPSNDWKMKGQTIIMGKCPYHNDSTPSFSLMFDKGMGKCFGAGCEKLVTDIINLVAKLRNCSYVEALLFVYHRFDIGDELASKANEFNEYNQVQEVKKAAAIAMTKIVELVIKDCPDYLEYCIPAVSYLVDVRKIPQDVLPLMPVGVFGKPVHMKEFIPQSLHAAYDIYFGELESDTYYGCICFHYNDSPGSISRFKLRHKNQVLLSKLAKFDDYKALPEAEKGQLFFKGNSHYVADPYTNEIGVFGLHRYQSMIGKNDSNAYITEGEFDALSVMAAQFHSGNVNFMIFAIGGKGATDVSFLREYGIRTIWLVSDHPAKQGDDWAKSVLQDKNNFVGALGQTSLQFKVFIWPPEMKGGDLDEAVILMGYSVVEEYLQRNRNAYFLNSLAWINLLVDRGLALIDDKYNTEITLLSTTGKERDNEVSNIEAARKGDLQDAILLGLRLVHNTADKQEYASKFVTDRGIDITKIEAVNTTVYALDTTQGAVDRVIMHLKEFFELTYYIKHSGITTVYAWSKKNEELIEIPSNDRGMLITIALHVKLEIEQWFDIMLGENSVYTDGITPEDKALTRSKKKRANGRLIVDKAFEQMMRDLQNYENLKILSQGLHYLDLPDVLRQQGIIYFVNGKKVFRGQYKNEGEVEWTRIHNIVDNGVVFEDVSLNQKWSYVDDVADLYEAPLVDLNKLFDQIVTILNGWCFKEHAVTVQYLAAYIMSLTVMRATSDINITCITGQTTSGKTAFAGGLLSGSGAKQNACPYILESVYQMDDTTLPGLYQSMEGKSHLVVIDEAESGDKYSTKKDENFKEVVRMAHNMPMGGSLIQRGGKDKASRKSYYMKFPLLMSAINLPASAVFLSRTIVITTQRDLNHRPVEQHIDAHFTHKDLEEIRKGITIGMIPHIPQLMSLRKKLSESLREGGRKVAKVSNRFLDCILTPLTVYEFLGKDSAKLYHNILKANKDTLESVHSQDAQNELLDGCLYTTSIRMMSLDNMVGYVSVTSLLVSAEYKALNDSGCGVYFIKELNWIILVWKQVKYGVLAKTKFAGLEESALKQMAQRDPYVKKVVTAEDHKIIKHHLDLKDVKSKDAYSIMELEYLMGVTVTEEEGAVSIVDTPPGEDLLDFLMAEEPTPVIEVGVEVEPEPVAAVGVEVEPMPVAEVEPEPVVAPEPSLDTASVNTKPTVIFRRSRRGVNKK